MGLQPRCLPGSFASAFHMICLPTLACFPSISSMLDTLLFFLLRLARLKGKEEGLEGGCPGRLDLEELAANSGLTGRAFSSALRHVCGE